MKNKEFAEELISRLNYLIGGDEKVRKAVSLLCETQLTLPRDLVKALCDHPSIQVMREDGGTHTMGLVGLLNGVVGQVGTYEYGAVARLVETDTRELIEFKLIPDGIVDEEAGT